MLFKWATDVHFDHVVLQENFQKFVDASQGKLLVVSGDITTAQRFDIDFAILSKCAERVLFVCGNHCHWGGRSIKENRKKIDDIIGKKYPNMTYLSTVDEPIVFDDAKDTAFVGHDGWYDARVGSPHGVVMNDWMLIRDFGPVVSAHAARYDMDIIINVSRRLADEATSHIIETSKKAIARGAKQVYIITHVPPYVDAHVHNNRPPDPLWVPWFVNVRLGMEIDDLAAKNPDTMFKVLCGHTHGKTLYNRASNVVVHVGNARYGKPEVQNLILSA